MTEQAYELRAAKIANKVYFNRSMKKIKAILNPFEIEETFKEFRALSADIQNEFLLDKAIRDFISPTTQESFLRYSDKSELSKDISRNYIKTNGTPLDIQAMEISTNSSFKVEIDDIVNHIKKYPKRDFKTEKEEYLELFLEEFKEKTEINLTQKLVSFYFLSIGTESSEDCPF